MASVNVEIINRLGLHARAASKLTQLASTFKSEIFISKAQQRVNAKSIMGVMLLAAGKGMTVTLDAEGEDAEEALKAITQLFNERFGEPD
ncbi:HPr family phosphocarrier protein [Pelistega europaea]|uniref:HPr family phosphocarrier protein n=1 Tax=Pelistega europaea TaxID=106147 RepID=A0A7Y4P4U9_9BURK|nr:HPr family phosphocarrier protein [Pelistega europaea]NOL49876.1 HPr family phosphocarrier protein [Pelistega europaea]